MRVYRFCYARIRVQYPTTTGRLQTSSSSGRLHRPPKNGFVFCVSTFCAYAAEFSWNSLIPASSPSRTSSRSTRRTCQWTRPSVRGEEEEESACFVLGGSSAFAWLNNSCSPRQKNQMRASRAKRHDRQASNTVEKTLP